MEILAEAFDGLDGEQWIGLIRVKDRRGLEVPPNRLMRLVNLPNGISWNVHCVECLYHGSCFLSCAMAQVLRVSILQGFVLQEFGEGDFATLNVTFPQYSWERIQQIPGDILHHYGLTLAFSRVRYSYGFTKQPRVPREAVVVQARSMSIVIMSSSAYEYYNDWVLAAHHAHLDLEILHMKNLSSFTGLLPELWAVPTQFTQKLWDTTGCLCQCGGWRGESAVLTLLQLALSFPKKPTIWTFWDDTQTWNQTSYCQTRQYHDVMSGADRTSRFAAWQHRHRSRFPNNNQQVSKLQTNKSMSSSYIALECSCNAINLMPQVGASPKVPKSKTFCRQQLIMMRSTLRPFFEESAIGFIAQTVWPHWGVLTVRVTGWFDWGARPGAECGQSVFPAQGHKKRVWGGQNLRFACAKRLLGEVCFAFRIGRLTSRCGWNSVFLRIRIGRLTSRCGFVSLWRGANVMFGNATVCGFPARWIAPAVAPCWFWFIWWRIHSYGRWDLCPETWIF